MNANSISWMESTDEIDLSRDKVHLWLSDVDISGEEFEYLASLLSRDELDRAERFVLRQHRERYVVARGVLRKLLSKYTGIQPASICFSYDSHGKPSLNGSVHRQTVDFNLSHSNKLIIYAVAVGRKLGVDIEYIRRDVQVEGIARRFFTECEQEKIMKLPQSARREAFFYCWTCKEAYIKARGEGLSLSPNIFEVSFGPREAAALLKVDFDQKEVERWSIRNFVPQLDYVAALAVEDGDFRLSFWRFDDL
jgi:4'-phosphopantetheinyl transferase